MTARLPKPYRHALEMASELRALTGEENAGPLSLEEEANLMYLECKTFAKSAFSDFDFNILWAVCAGYRSWAQQDLNLRLQLIDEGD